MLVAITAAVGYRLAGGTDGGIFFWTMLGTILASSSSGVLNMYLERDADALMKRTMNRPLPAGRMKPGEALIFGIALGAWGIAVLAMFVNALAAVLAALTITLYVAFYTPLKRVTQQSTWIGAVSGAIPPMIGWAGATGELGLGAWLLFGIQLLWQIPHFLALFWLYREDYARAGFKFSPVLDPEGGSTRVQIALHSFSLLIASMLPTYFGVSGLAYGYGALLVSGAFLIVGLKASWTLEEGDTRRLFRASLAYLPAVFTLILAV
jgi:protoheme IX farnesyltransferase